MTKSEGGGGGNHFPILNVKRTSACLFQSLVASYWALIVLQPAVILQLYLLSLPWIIFVAKIIFLLYRRLLLILQEHSQSVTIKLMNCKSWLARLTKNIWKKATMNTFSVIDGSLRWINCLCSSPTGNEGAQGRITQLMKSVMGTRTEKAGLQWSSATSLFLQQWHDTVGWVCDCACRCVYKRLCKKKHVRQIECFGDCMESWVESVGYGAFCLLSTLNIHF